MIYELLIKQIIKYINYLSNDLTLVNFEHVSSASFIRFARNMYLAHFELIYLSAVSKPCASSSHLYAS